MKPIDTITFVFNKFFSDFLDDIKSDYPHEIVVKQTSTRYIKHFNKNVKNGKLIEAIKTETNATILQHEFIKVVEMYKGIKFSDIKAPNDMLVCYLYHFVLMSTMFIRIDNADCSDSDDEDSSNEDEHKAVFDALKLIQKCGDETITSFDGVSDLTVLMLLEKISSVSVKKQNLVKDEEEENDPFAMLENSKIGNLAKEISQEIDLSEIKIEKPEDIMGLMSGSGTNGLGNIISKVGEKIQTKIANGEIKHEELMSEVLGMLGNMGGKNKGGKNDGMAGMANMFNNPMMKQMLASMGLPSLPSPSLPSNVQVDQNKVRNMSARDRLKKKLDTRTQPL